MHIFSKASAPFAASTTSKPALRTIWPRTNCGKGHTQHGKGTIHPLRALCHAYKLLDLYQASLVVAAVLR